MTDATNPIQINPTPSPPEEKPAGFRISVKKIFLSLFIIFICLLLPILILFLNPFGILTDRINQAKTIATVEKSDLEKFIDGVVLFPEKVTGKVIPTDRKVDSFLNEQIKSYYENSDKKPKTPIRYSNQPDFSSTSPTATPSGNNVQGVSTGMGEVLQATTTNQLYFQYIPLPGKANFSSSQFNGSATINFPLKFPQGPGGFTPSASINYSSNSVDELLHGIDTKKLPFFTRQSGSLGLGWSLSTGDGSIVLDNHGYDDPCRYTYKLTFPGGSAEFFKINTTTGKKAACGTEWTNSTTWRTDPEMFLKIEQGKASQLFPGDPDFTFDSQLIFDRYNNKGDPVYHQNPKKERLDIWKITTSDGTEYVFGSGKQPLSAQRSNEPEYSSYTFVNKDCYYSEQVTSEVKSWKLYRVKNIFGQKIKYGYNQVWQAAILDVNTSPRQCDYDVITSKIANIQYPPNKVIFNYISTRKDTFLVKEDSGNFWQQIPEEHTYVDKDALSSIDVYTNGQISRKYNLAYYDTWVDTPNLTEAAASCRALADSTPLSYQVKGYYSLNDNIQSYHLMPKSIEECIPDASGACSAVNTLPKQTFTYQNIPYDVNSFSNAGTDICRQIRTTTITNNRNSIYLKTAGNGFSGSTEYMFEAKRISDRIYLPNGASYVDNNYDGFNCLNYCWGAHSQAPACGSGSECNGDWRRTYERPFRQRGLKRARLVKVKVFDGIGNSTESLYDYGANEPITVLKQVGPNMEPENAYDSEFVGYANFTAYSGKKNLAVDKNNPIAWASKSKTFYHQMLTATSCAKKDPRAGSGYLTQSFDDNGIISESLQYLRFKNDTDIKNNDPWPKPNGEFCTDVPDRPLVLNYGSKQITVSEGKPGSVPPSPSPQIAINSASDKSCTDFCKDRKTFCAGAGLDAAASNMQAHNFVPPKGGNDEYCEVITMTSCADVLNKKGGVCGGNPAKWTQCRCVPETAVPAGFNTLLASCAVSSNVPSYCNITSEKKEYVWDLNLVDKYPDNIQNGKFAANTKSESFFKKAAGGSYQTEKKLASSETRYVSKIDGGVFMLNKPYETWNNNSDNSTDTAKYKWQKMYYDNLANGVLGTGKNLLTKTETLLSNGTVAGKSEVVAYDAWGNVIQTKDGNGNTSSTTYDLTYHIYPLTVTNPLGQTTTTTYDYKLGVPLTVTDANNLTTKSTYDMLGRLIKVYKPGDATNPDYPSAVFEYHFLNESTTQTQDHGVPIAVKALVYTKQNDRTVAPLETYDLYDGLGNKIQSQSLVNGKVITMYGDQDDWSKTNRGLKTYSAENFVSSLAFGKFNKNIPSGTKISYSFTNPSGQNWKNIDINNNISYAYSNPENFTAKTIAPNGLYTYTVSDPIARTKTTSVCKDLQITDENTFLNNTSSSGYKFSSNCPGSGQKITSESVADFMGNITQVKDTKGKVLTSNFYDSLGRLRTNDYSSEDADLGKSYILSYDLNGNILSTKNAQNTIFITSYDALNRPLSKTVTASGESAKVTNSFTYDAGPYCGVTPKGKLCLKVEWDNFGNPINKYFKYDILGKLAEERANYGGNLAAKFGSADFVTSYTYDNIDRVLTVKYPEFAGSGIASETVTNTYSGPYLQTVKGDKSYITGLTYDDLGRLKERSLGNSEKETYTYDNPAITNGDRRLWKIQVAKGTTNSVNLVYNYDNPTGNILGITDNAVYTNPLLSKTMNYKYDNLSRLVCADPGTNCNNAGFTNALDTYGYDDLNNLLNKKEEKAYSFAVDGYFPYHGVKNINNSSTPVSYDVLGRMKKYTIPNEYSMEVLSFDLNSGKPQKIAYTNLTNLAALPTSTPIISPTVTKTPTPTTVAAAAKSPTPTATKTRTPTPTVSGTPLTKSPTPTVVKTKTPTPTVSGVPAVKSPTPTVTKTTALVAAGTVTKSLTPTVVRTKTPTPTQTQSSTLTLRPSTLNTNKILNSTIDASKIMAKVRSTCTVSGYNYLSFKRGSKSYLFAANGNKVQSKDFKVSANKPFSVYYAKGKSSCKVTFPSALGIEAQAQTPTNTVTEVYYYDGEGRRIMKALADSAGKLTNEVLYINQYLEKDLSDPAKPIVRKNYYADGKLVAVRVFNDLSNIPTPIISTPTITLTPTKTRTPTPKLTTTPEPTDKIIPTVACFTENMKVVLADNKMVYVKDIKVNDKVISYNETNGKFEPNTVLQTYQSTVDSYFEVKLENGTTLEVTADHPILKDNLVFTKTKDLKVGDKVILNAQNKIKTVAITSIELVYRTVPVFNIETEKYHTFVVEGIIVHNKLVSPTPTKILTSTPIPTCVKYTAYRDADADGYGTSKTTTTYCSGSAVPAGYVTNSTDCCDSDSGVHPGAPLRSTASTCGSHDGYDQWDLDCNGTVTKDTSCGTCTLTRYKKDKYGDCGGDYNYLDIPGTACGSNLGNGSSGLSTNLKYKTTNCSDAGAREYICNTTVACTKTCN